jgi:hypothetical protein
MIISIILTFSAQFFQVFIIKNLVDFSDVAFFKVVENMNIIQQEKRNKITNY